MKMRLEPTLYLWQGLWPLTLVGWAIAIPLVLFEQGVLETSFAWIDLLVLAHSLAIAFVLGRFRSGEFAFLLGRGFARDALWRHTMAASALGVLGVWLPPALIVWTPLRATLQDRLLENPLFPFMAPCERFAPWLWLGMYAALLPVFHWLWIRDAQPEGHSGALALIAVGAAVAVVDSREAASRAVRWGEFPPTTIVMIASTLLVALIALAATRRLYRSLEAQA